MAISIELIKELREKTGSGMMDCKKALTESDGNIEKAIDWLREKGIASADKKMSRITAEGIVDAYIHGGGRVGVLIEVNIETDFAAKNPDFRAFVKDVAMQIAASSPLYVQREDVPAEVVEKEKEILKQQAMNEGKPANIAEKMVTGRVDKFFKQICLLEQPFIKDTDKTVQDIVNEKIAMIGEKISIRRFTRYEMGEGLTKKEDNFAEEVMKQVKG